MSDYSFDRAIADGLLDASELAEISKEEFKQEVQTLLGLAPGQDCDSICSAMSHEEFQRFVAFVKEKIRSKKRNRTQFEQPLYA